MNLTKEQQLLALMLCDIHEALNINPDQASVNAKFVREAISSGCQWALDMEHIGQNIPSEQISSETVDFVSNVFDMYEIIEVSFDSLNPQDKQHVLDESSAISSEFEGFDGNNESDYKLVARFLVDEMDRFHRIGERANINSHCPKVDKYKAMLDTFLPTRNEFGVGAPLSREQLIAILGARVNP